MWSGLAVAVFSQPFQLQRLSSLIPVIISGGAGSRRWSFSRELHPKLIICLADGQNLFQKACMRGAQLPGQVVQGNLVIS